MNILYLVRSVPPYLTNRIDVDYIIHNLIKKGFSVDIYDIKQRLLLNCQTGTKKYYFKHCKIFKLYPFYLVFNFFVFFWFLISKRKKYDITHIFYVREEYLILAKFLRKFSPKLYLSIYGSDINDFNIIKKKYKLLYHFADLITVDTLEFAEKIISKNYELYFSRKIKILSFPQIRLKRYEFFKYEDKLSAKKKLGYEKYRKVIIVGTNATVNEQHIKIIDELARLQIDGLLFIFPLTYGPNMEKNRQRIKKYIELKIKNNDYRIIFDYLSEDDLYDLRIASDIFINLRKNDLLTCSMLESFMCDVVVITGSWLPYRLLDELNIYYKKIDQIGYLVPVLSNIIYNNNDKYQLSKNRESIWNYFNLDKNIMKWIELYEN